MPDITKQVEQILRTTKVIPLHTHNGTDSLQINESDINQDGSTPTTTNIFPGSVDSLTGSLIIGPTGWTGARVGTGIYDITHNLGTTSYVVVITMTGIDATSDSVCYTTRVKSANSFEVSIVSSTDPFININSPFDFILMQP